MCECMHVYVLVLTDSALAWGTLLHVHVYYVSICMCCAYMYMHVHVHVSCYYFGAPFTFYIHACIYVVA